VFSIDIEDGVPPLKLPYNITDDPWTIAQEFIHEHNLSQLYLDQIANFIMKNSQGMHLTQTSSDISDPFTGGSRYVPQTNDSFINNTQNQTINSSEYFPQREHLKFESINIEGIAKKLKEFCEQIPPEFRLNSNDIQTLLKLSDLSQEVQPEQIRLIKLMLSWPKSKS
jgi:phospholipase A-2-activating protein